MKLCKKIHLVVLVMSILLVNYRYAEAFARNINFSVQLSSAADIESFAVPGSSYAAVIDPSKKFIRFIMPQGADKSSLMPQITVSEGATISPAPGAVTNFNAPVEYAAGI